MDNVFNSVRITKPARNLFDLSFENRLTLGFGDLVPILNRECYPGDHFRLSTEIYTRFMPLVAPVMHDCNVYLHYFFVPYRLVYEDWNDFLTNGPKGDTTYTPPYTSLYDLCLDAPAVYSSDDWLTSQSAFNTPACQIPNNSLCDYMGEPTTGDFLAAVDTPLSFHNIIPADKYQELPVSLLHYRAYQLIYNEFYRDENLIPEVEFSRSGGYMANSYDDSSLIPEVQALFTLRHRAWKRDYFTASLPFAQKGAQAVLPLGLSAPVTGTLGVAARGMTDDVRHWLALDNNTIPDQDFSDGVLALQNASADGRWALTHNLSADLSNAVAATINDFRVALRVQQWLEANARCGSRYIEQILAHFGVMTPDARLQRPEFIGGSYGSVQVSEVMNQAEAGALVNQGTADKPNYLWQNETVLGMPSGKATAYDNGTYVDYYCYEHGCIMGILSILPRSTYFQGVRRERMRTSNFDFYWPEFATLGEQGTNQGELYVPFTDSANPQTSVRAWDSIFGYMPRYQELRCYEDEIHGDFRDTLNTWHIAREFDEEPDLDKKFIEVNGQLDGLNRIFSVEVDKRHKPIVCQIWTKCNALRPLPVYAVPSLL